jgi:hypothetical protein
MKKANNIVKIYDKFILFLKLTICIIISDMDLY